MYFPTAGIETQIWLPPLAAFGISLLTSTGGVSGAFLLLPFQISFLGYDAPSVSATNHIFNIVAVPGGVYRYIREGRMVWPLTWAVVIGTLPGVFVGTVIRVKYLPDPTAFKRFAAAVLLYIGLRLLCDILKKGRRRERKQEEGRAGERTVTGCISHISNTRFSLKSLSYSFAGQEYQADTPSVMLLSLLVGLAGGIYGIGGGAIIAPFLVTFYGLPVYTVAGAALTGTMITSLAGVGFFRLLAFFMPETAIAPDWQLGLLFGLGGFAGMYCGARLQRFVPSRFIKSILAACILFTCTHYLF